MALELSKLVFQVDTTQLDEAQNKIKQLGTAMTNVNAPAAKMAKETQTVVVATEASTEAAKKNVSVLQRQKDIYDFMIQGMSKGQATVLAQAKATGVLSDELKELTGILQAQRKLQGGDPFDKSMAGLTSLKNRLVELKEANRLYVAGIELTREQTRELARDKERLIERAKATGKSFSEIKYEIIELNKKYIETAGQVNSLVAVERELERQQRDRANASRALVKEEERIAATLGVMEKGTDGVGRASERTASKVAIYARNLRLAGVTGDEATKKLEAYRKKLIQVQAVEEKRNVDLLSRALAPQISDVVVSLGSGMNPMTVLLQQGLQVRDLIGQSGVEIGNLQKAFKSAASDMVSSIKGTAVALGSLLIGALTDAGKAIGKFSLSLFGADTVLASMRNRLIALVGVSNSASKAVFALDLAIKGLALSGGLIIAGLAVALISLGVGFFKAKSENDALTRSLVLSGATLGLNTNSAIALANSMNDVGISTSKAIKVMTEIAKQGGFASSQIRMITTAAVDLEKYGGVAVEETVKQFAKLRDEPAKALSEIAIATGLVRPEMVRLVNDLEMQGKKSEAAGVAMKAYADVVVGQKDRLKNELSEFSTFMIGLGSAISNFFDGAFKQLFQSTKISDVETRLKSVQAAKSSLGARWAQGMVGQDLDAMEAKLLRELRVMKEQAAVSADVDARNVKKLKLQQDAFALRDQYLSKEVLKERELLELERTKSELTAEEYQRTKKGIEDKFKPEKTPKTSEERFYDKYLKRLTVNALEAGSAQGELTKSQEVLLSVLSDPEWVKLGDAQQQSLLKKAYAAIAAEQAQVQLKQAEEARMQAQKEAFEIDAKRLDEMADYDLKLREATISIKEESDMLEFQANMIGRTSDERKKAIEIKKIELELEKELAEIRQKYAGSLDLESRLLQAQKNAASKIANLNKQMAIDAAFELQTSLSDAIETALFEGGKAGSKKLRDIIVAELRKPIRVFIEAIVSGFVGNIFGMGSGSSSGSAGGLGASAGGIGSLSTISKAYEILSGGLNVATGAGQGLSNLMAKTVSQFGANAMTTFTTQFTSGMMSTGSMAAAKEAFAGTGAQMGGLIVGSVLNGLSGYGISKALSGGYSAGNGINTIAGIASMIPGIGPIAGVVGGLVNRAFGRKAPVTTGSGITGTFSTTGANVSQYQDWFSKGGWFRKNKSGRNYSAVSSEFDKFLDQSLMQITATTKAYASVLGLIPEAIDGVTQSINISLMNLSAEQQQAEIEKALGGFSDTLAMNLLGTWETSVSKVLKSGAELALEAMFLNSGLIGKDNMGVRNSNKMSIDRYKEIITKTWKPGDFVREGETAGQALARLATSLTTVNSVFDTLNQTLYGTSLVGADAASKLLDAFGGAENFSKLTTDYYQNFYTEQERIATTTRQLTTIFEKMGLTLPTTRDEFRQLVEAQNLYTDEGRATYAALLNLAPAFATITEEMGSAAQEAAELANRIKDLTDSLIDEIRRLRGETATGAADNGLSYYQAQFTAANAAAVAGDLTALEQLPELAKVVEEAAKLQATSSQDVIRIQAWLAQSLANTTTSLGNPVPQFASGGVHTGGARIVGENGPELEVTGPSRIFSANTTNDMFGGLAEKLNTLNENITGLRAEVRADVSYNAKVAKLLDRVIPEGDYINIGGTIDGGQV